MAKRRIPKKHNELIENNQVVRCPVCDSTDVIRVLPFDYIKMCMNDNCVYYLGNSKKWRRQFITGVHN